MTCQTFAHDKHQWAIQQLALFISDVQTVQDKQLQPLILQSNPWQQARVALLNMALADCASSAATTEQASNGQSIESSASSLSNNQLRFTSSIADATELRFVLGIPFELNHLNPLEQDAPLNIPSMFWSWRGGHKFLRLDMTGEPQSWSFHLGSTGCVADSAMRAPQISCVNPNTVNIQLHKQQDGARLLVHVDRLLAGVTLSNKRMCLMQAEQASCQLLMDNLQHNQVFEWR